MKLEQATFTVFSDKQEEVKEENTYAQRLFIQKESLERVFFCEISKNTFCYETPVTALARVFFCKISKNTFCYETPLVTASGQILNFSSEYQP